MVADKGLIATVAIESNRHVLTRQLSNVIHGQRRTVGKWFSKCLDHIGKYFCGVRAHDKLPVIGLKTRCNLASVGPLAQSATLRSRSALLITESELRLMAAAAIIGLSSSPTRG